MFEVWSLRFVKTFQPVFAPWRQPDLDRKGLRMTQAVRPTRIDVVRHAESVMNLRAGELVGGRSNDTPLSDTGRSSAQALGRELTASCYHPDVVYCTSAVRSKHTAELIIEGAGWALTPRVDDGLIELSQGAAEGQPRGQWWTPQAQAAATADPLRHRLAPDGENHHEVQARMRGALHRIAAAHRAERVLVVGHGIAIRTLVWALRGGGHEVFRGLALPNLGRVSFEVGESIQLLGEAE